MEESLNRNNRRDFLKKLTWGLTGASLAPLDLLAASEKVMLTILHTNDVHSHIDPFPDNDPKYPGLGGAARRAALINKIRQEQKNVLLFDAGDIYQGTPYFNRYNGELEIKLMSRMKYDASAIGNHDFDNGIEGITRNLPLMEFPLICANYDFSDTAMNGKTIPYKIFIKEGIKIGVFGLGIELDGLVDKRMYGKTRFLNPEEQAAKHALYLKNEEKCHLIVCLSHLGFKYQDNKISDIELARRSRFIDIIIGGHTHTFLDKPVIQKNIDGQEVHVCQVGWAGIKLGRIDVVFDRNKPGKKSVSGTAMHLPKNIYETSNLLFEKS
ncbi:MAG: bifunctional metallophosphatase/5'-nucleotidase [Bacteroidota bacterium]